MISDCECENIIVEFVPVNSLVAVIQDYMVDYSIAVNEAIDALDSYTSTYGVLKITCIQRDADFKVVFNNQLFTKEINYSSVVMLLYRDEGMAFARMGVRKHTNYCNEYSLLLLYELIMHDPRAQNIQDRRCHKR